MLIAPHETAMPRESVVFSTAIVGVIVGLSILLLGEAQGGRFEFLTAGGILVLLSVGWIAVTVSRLEEPE